MHLDLFCPSKTLGLNGKYYVFIIVDDFSRLTPIIFLTHKSDAFTSFSHFCKRTERECGHSIVKNQSGHGEEFENDTRDQFRLEQGIEHSFCTPRTPKKMVLLKEKIRLFKIWHELFKCFCSAKIFFGRAINTACYILNRIFICPTFGKGFLWTLSWKNPKYWLFSCLWLLVIYSQYQGQFGEIWFKISLGIFYK